MYHTNKQIRMITFQRRRKKKATPNVDLVEVMIIDRMARITYTSATI